MASLTEGGIVRPLLALAAPFAVGNLFNVLNAIVDRIWVGDVGTEAMAALGTAVAGVMVLSTISLGMALGTLSGVARATGRGDHEAVETWFGQGLIIGLVTGVLMAVGGFFAPEWIMAFMGSEPAVSQPAAEYLRISMWGMLAQIPFSVMTFSLQGAGRARAALAVGVVSPVVNLILDPILIFTAGLGLAGAAWATTISYVAAIAVGVPVVQTIGVRWTRSLLRVRSAVAEEIIRIGVPGTIEHLVRTTASFSLVKLITPFGAIVVSAYTSAMVLLLALVFPGLAMGQATASLVGQNLGAGKPRRAWKTAWVAVGLYAAFMFAIALLIYWQAPAFIAVFDDNPPVVAEGVRLLRIVVTCLPFIAVALVLSKAFGGAGKTMPAMFAAAGGHLVWQIPAVYWLSQAYGPPGAYWGMATAFMVHALISTVLFVRRFAPGAQPIAKRAAL